MNTNLLYLIDPLKLQFEANIMDKKLVGDKYAVVLSETYFYPTGGGQDHDLGKIGEANVIDVYKDDHDNVLHIIDQDLELGRHAASIHSSRRLRNMQHHSAQHILTHSFQSVLGLETVSVKIQGDSPSTIDMFSEKVTVEDLSRVEDYANEIVFTDKEIKSYFVNQDEIKNIPFRRPPVVTGTIRVIEVDKLDYSACGGTHCLRTGMIGLIKIIKTEHQSGKLRVYFVAGRQSLQYLRDYQNIISQVAGLLSVRNDMIVDVLSRQLVQLGKADEELKKLRMEQLPTEAKKLFDASMEFEGLRLITASFEDRLAGELRSVGMLLKDMPKVVALLILQDSQKLSILVSCSSDSGINANDLLKKILPLVNGKGGGDPRIAQGGGQANPEVLPIIFDGLENYIRELIG